MRRASSSALLKSISSAPAPPAPYAPCRARSDTLYPVPCTLYPTRVARQLSPPPLPPWPTPTRLCSLLLKRLVETPPVSAQQETMYPVPYTLYPLVSAQQVTLYP